MTNKKRYLVNDFQFGAHADRERLSDPLERYGQQIYEYARSNYADAGEPFGPCDKAMLVWYTFKRESGYTEPGAGKN